MLVHHMYHAYALSRGAITCILDALVLPWGSVQTRPHGEWSYHVYGAGAPPFLTYTHAPTSTSLGGGDRGGE